MLNPPIVSIEREIFARFLEEVKTLMEKKRIKPPAGFISYAWEAPADGQPNKTLQAWLSQLKKDFAALDIDLFLDIHNINGDMRAAMREIKTRDFVFLIGTPRFKERAEQDVLYRLPTFNPQLLPMTGNAIVMVDNSDKIFVIEKDNQGLSLIGETTLARANSTQIVWKQEVGYERAQSSEVVHQLIEQALKQVSSKTITNVAYEFGLTLDKVKQWPQALMPLLYQGDFGVSFPKDISANILIRDFSAPAEYYRSLISTRPLGLLPAICPQLQTDKDYAQLVDAFLEWKFEVWQEQLAHRFREELQLYIPARGDYTAECRNPKPMEAHVAEFMQQHAAKVLLVLGGSGSGKTSFGQYLSTVMAQQHYTTIWISLPALQNPKEHAMEEGLKLLGVPASHIPSFKQKPLLIILDGYDEVKDLGNLYESNRLGDWNAKVMITCRHEFLTAKNYHLWFKPKNGHYVERHVAPFNSTEISAYLQKYIALQHPSWDLARYEAEIAQIEGLKQMIETPFLLHIVADVLPDMISQHQGKDKEAALKITKRALYERFVDQWFEKHLVRWEEQGKLALLDEGLDLDKDNQQEWIDERITVLRSYAENFAHRLFSAEIETISPKAEYPWIKELFDNKPRAKLIRSGCPLKKTGEDTYGFIHKSLLEYLVTPKMVEEAAKMSQGKQEVSSSSSSSSRPSALSQELAHLNQQLLTPAMVQFLADALEEKPALEAGLWAIIYASRGNEGNAIAAANAITVLNRARVSFSGKDLSGIKIPGANLTGAVLDNTNLRDSDLRNVALKGAWLQGTRFEHARMAGMDLGEFPALQIGNDVFSCAYSPDGCFLAGTKGDNVKLYDAATRRLVRTFTGHTKAKAVFSVTFSPDGQRLATGSDDKTARIWSVATGKVLQTFTGHTTGVSSVSFSPDGQRLGTGSYDMTARVWSVATGEVLQTFTGHTAVVWSVAFSPDGQRLATGSEDNIPRLWSVATGEVLQTFRGYIHSVAFSSNGEGLATGPTIWSVAAGQVLQTLTGHTDLVSSVAFSPDGMRVATGSWDKTARVWSVATGEVLQIFTGHTDVVRSVVFSPDGMRLATGSRDRTVRFWSVTATKELQHTFTGQTRSVRSVVFSPDGMRLATGSDDKTVRVWSMATSQVLETFTGHTRNVTSVAFSPDGMRLATGSDDQTARIWSVARGQVLHTFTGHTRGLTSVVFSPDGMRLATGSDDRTARIWSVATGQVLQTFTGHTSDLTSVAFSPDGMRLATGSWDKTARIWSVATGHVQQTLKGHKGSAVTSVAFSPDGQRLATTSECIVRLWSVTTGEPQQTFKHTLYVSGVAFSPEGQYLATSGSTLWLWHISPKEATSVVTKLSSKCNSLAFRPHATGVFLATGHEDCSVRYWQLLQVNQQPYLQLLWTSHQEALFSPNANLTGVQGLSDDNMDLLKQRGAIDEALSPWTPPKLFSPAAQSASASSSSTRSNNPAQEQKNEHQGETYRENKCTLQ